MQSLTYGKPCVKKIDVQKTSLKAFVLHIYVSPSSLYKMPEIQSTLHSVNVHLVNGFKRDRSTPSKEKRAKELRIQ